MICSSSSRGLQGYPGRLLLQLSLWYYAWKHFSERISFLWGGYSKAGKLRLHCAGVNTDVDLQKLCANGDLFLLLFLFGLLCFLYCLRAFQWLIIYSLWLQPWMQSAHELLDFLVSREDATPFRHPVDLNDFPVSLLVNRGCLIVKKDSEKKR